MQKSKALPILPGAAALAVAGLLTAAPAQATVVVPPTAFDFTSCHIDAGCGTPPFGTVTLTQDGANVDFDVNISPNTFVETGAADMQLFKFNDHAAGATAASIINATFVSNGPAGGLQGATGSFTGDGTGSFGFGVECIVSSQCNGNSGMLGSEITFTVTSATIAQLTVGNPGIIFVADALIGGTANGATGPIDVSVPAPLIGHGLVVLLAVGGVLFGGKLLENRKKLHLQAEAA